MTNIFDPLAKFAAEKKQIFGVLGMRNVYGISLEKRVEMDVEYRRAEQEWRDAEYAYQRALDLFRANQDDLWRDHGEGKQLPPEANF